MKKIISKEILTKILILVIMFFSILIIFKPISIATSDAQSTSWGGKLLQPVLDLIMTIGDAAMSFMQKNIMGGVDAVISVNKASTNFIGYALLAAIAVLAIIAVVVLSGGIAALGAALIETVKNAGLAVFVQGVKIAGIKAAAVLGTTIVVAGVGVGGIALYNVVDDTFFPEVTILPQFTISPEEIFRGDILLFDVDFFEPKKIYTGTQEEYNELMEEAIIDTNVTNQESNQEESESIEENTDDIAFYYYLGENNKKVITSAQNTAQELKDLISKWYYTFRNVAVVALMIILVYVGIRIVLSSTSNEKSKYKEMLYNWVIGLCLLFVMHYIMIFAIQLTDSITDMIKNVSDKKYSVETIAKISDANLEKYEEALKNYGYDADEFIQDDGDGGKMLVWPTNLLGIARIRAQMMDGGVGYVGYLLCYVILVMFTAFFVFTYAKRVLTLAFFTIIAPLVAITYPIDKMNDGKAQGFDMWLKEYIFNLLIQPLHLLLYTVLVTLAFEFAGQNLVYTLVAIGFMIPAEKLLRKMFNFEKSSTTPFLSGAGGAALAMAGISKLSKLGSAGGKISSSGGKSGEKANIRTSNVLGENGFDELFSVKDTSNSSSVIRNTLVDNNDSGNNGGATAFDILGNDSNKTSQQRMLEADEKSFGTSDFDPLYYNSLVESENNENIGGMQYTADEYRDILEQSGYEGEELERMMLEQGYGPSVNQRMLEVDEEKFGTSDFDPEYYNALAGDSYGNDVSGMQYTADEYRDILLQSGYEGQELERLMEEQGYEVSKDKSQMISNEPSVQQIYEGDNAIQTQNVRTSQQLSQREMETLQENNSSVSEEKTNMDRLKAIRNVALRDGLKKVPSTIGAGTRLVGAATLGTIGFAAGVAAGDPMKAGSYAVTGAYAGKAVANIPSNIAKKVQSRPHRGEEMLEAYRKEIYGNDYKNKKRELEKVAFVKNKEQREKYEKGLDLDKKYKNKEERNKILDQVMKDALEYKKFHVQDDDIIIKAMKINDGKAHNNRASSDKIASAVIATKSKNQKDVDEYKKRLAKQGLTDEQINFVEKNAKKLNNDI